MGFTPRLLLLIQSPLRHHVAITATFEYFSAMFYTCTAVLLYDSSARGILRRAAVVCGGRVRDKYQVTVSYSSAVLRIDVAEGELGHAALARLFAVAVRRPRVGGSARVQGHRSRSSSVELYVFVDPTKCSTDALFCMRSLMLRQGPTLLACVENRDTLTPSTYLRCALSNLHQETAGTPLRLI